MIIVRKNQLIFNSQYFRCSLGKNGLKYNKKEGDHCTPIGIFSIGRIFYRSDRVLLPKLAIPTHKIYNNYGWCDDPKSNLYNQLIKFPFNYSAEQLHRNDSLYDIVCEIKYNDTPVIKHKGSAIFIHVATKDFKPTAGCVALQKDDLIKVLSMMDSKTKISLNN